MLVAEPKLGAGAGFSINDKTQSLLMTHFTFVAGLLRRRKRQDLLGSKPGQI